MAIPPASEERMPRWLLRPVRSGAGVAQVREVLRAQRLNTVCSSARCPNHGECFASGTATFMILGEVCTRDCGFCAVTHGIPAPPEADEPERLAEAARQLGLEHVVITSVTRDDIADGGASHFADTVRAVREVSPGAAVEVLTPDFSGDRSSLATVLEAGPHVFNHNVETVPELYPTVRPQAGYERSLALLKWASDEGFTAKSGLMVGLGETREQLRRVFGDMAQAGCRILTVGQYLRPARANVPVARFVPPEEFESIAEDARDAGLAGVAASPLTRSSYHAREVLKSSRESMDRDAILFQGGEGC
ncbi:MAG: lipoyl synthase [Candidatus Geothermincolia bacterium]